MRNILISFLGTGFYREADYKISKDKSFTTRFIQEAICEKLLAEDSLDNLKLYICLTEKAEKGNWLSVREIDYKTKEIKAEYKGLKEILEERNIDYEIVRIKDGRNEEEIWENFDIISNIFKEEDRVYLDITHSLRSIPIMMMAILNYAKYTKNIELGEILYGAFEVKDENNSSPIIDLSLFSTIMDWTKAVDEFLALGNGEGLGRILSKTKGEIFKFKDGSKKAAKSVSNLGNNIDGFTKSMAISESRQVVNLASQVLDGLNRLDIEDEYRFKPFEKVLVDIEESFKDFSGRMVPDIYKVCQLSLKFGYIQQGYTLLEENITSFLVEKYVGSENLKTHINDDELRGILSSMLYGKNEDITIYGACENYDPYYMEELMKDDLDLELAKLQKNIKDRRNNLNHGGFNHNKMDFSSASKALEGHLEEFNRLVIEKHYMDQEKFEGYLKMEPRKERARRIGLVFSHRLLDSQIKELREELDIEDYTYLEEDLQRLWSNIPPGELNMEEYLKPIENWMDTRLTRGDYVLIQGDYGASYRLVEYSKLRGYIPIYSTSIRKVEEEVSSGGEVSIRRSFKHVNFRRY